MKSKHNLCRRVSALALASAMAVSLAGCNTENVAESLTDFAKKQTGGVHAGQRLNNSAWINSDLDGAVDANTQVSLKDDFHTAINHDWLVSTQLGPTDASVSPLADTYTVLSDQLLTLFEDGDFPGDTEILPQADIDHLQQLLLTMRDLASDQQQRNALGTEPLRPYLDAIRTVSDMEGLTAYLAGEGGPQLLSAALLAAQVDLPISTRDAYTVHLSFPKHLLLDDPSNYRSMGTNAYFILQEKKNAVETVLVQLGYSVKEAQTILSRCLWLESALTRYLPDDSVAQENDYAAKQDNLYTLDMLAERQGNYPLTTLLEKAGLADSESFLVYQPLYLQELGQLYQASNLESLKAYLTVHTVLEALPLLDDDCVALSDRITAQIHYGEDTATPETSDTDTPETAQNQEKSARSQMISTYVAPLLNVAMQELYVTRYFTAESKQDITALVQEIVTYYRTMLQEEDWLSEETRQKAVEKLESICLHVLYPDVMPDYSTLNLIPYAEGGTLLDANAAIHRFDAALNAEKVNRPIDRNDWDLSKVPTAAVNAAYSPADNSINIMAGFLANRFTYDPDAPREQNLARLGTVIGHEISHGFDTQGYQFDKDGLLNNWWTNDDEVAFQLRANRLANYYNALSVLPGTSSGYNGNLVKTEAIADMGGMKCMLGLAAQQPGFDYDLFFTSYAQMWVTKNTFSAEYSVMGDVHPLMFLRTNVTLQQFEEFYTTYGIGPGDGMYLAPENRILVW